MIQFAGIAVLVGMLMIGLIITMASIIGYVICCKCAKQNKLWIKILLRTIFIIGISITLFPVLFFYMIISQNRKQDEQALIRERQAIEEVIAYDERGALNERYEKMGIMPDLWRQNPFADIRDNRAEGFSFVLPQMQTGNVDKGSTL